MRAERARGAVTIVVTTDAKIRALNRQFHATDAATDVLAFPLGGVGSMRRSEAESHQADGTPLRSVPDYERDYRKMPCHYLGDIVISYETARVNARRVGWRIADELELLVVHGTLHLLGYDDRSPRARARMWKRQAEILGREIPTARPRQHSANCVAC